MYLQYLCPKQRLHQSVLGGRGPRAQVRNSVVCLFLHCLPIGQVSFGLSLMIEYIIELDQSQVPSSLTIFLRAKGTQNLIVQERNLCLKN